MTPFTAAELERLLGRPVRAAVSPEDRSRYQGRRVLVTGAGGSIGGALARELAASGPAELVLVDHAELPLFEIERELQRSGAPIVAKLADVTRGRLMARIAADTRPDVVFHAAAYKHVTMTERTPAVAAGVNVAGAFETARAAASVGARFVLISSDKAAEPESVMGATKRLAEVVTRSLASSFFRPVVVRFGNVIGSSGSVLPILRADVRDGRPIDVTDPRATRYFMTPGEAVALLMRADDLGRAGEILWLEMGRPVHLGDLVDRLMALEGDLGFPAVPVRTIGLRPGEKRNETLSDRRLVFERTIDDRILVAREDPVSRSRGEAIAARLRRAAREGDDRMALAVLESEVEGFRPSRQARDVGRRAISARSGAPAPARRRGQAA